MREGGYYWVKAGSDAYLSDQDMTEIDERRFCRAA